MQEACKNRHNSLSNDDFKEIFHRDLRMSDVFNNQIRSTKMYILKITLVATPSIYICVPIGFSTIPDSCFIKRVYFLYDYNSSEAFHRPL